MRDNPDAMAPAGVDEDTAPHALSTSPRVTFRNLFPCEHLLSVIRGLAARCPQACELGVLLERHRDGHHSAQLIVAGGLVAPIRIRADSILTAIEGAFAALLWSLGLPTRPTA